MNGDHSSDSNRSLSPGISSLANLGNTCFLNSVLYTLRFTPGFCHNLHHLNADLQTKLKLENGRQKPDPDQENLVDVIHTLHHLFQKLCSSDGYTGDPKDPVLPSALLQSVGRLCPLFEGNQQQDAHELLVTLITHLQDVKLGAQPSSRHHLDSVALDHKKGRKKTQQNGSTANLIHAVDANSVNGSQNNVLDRTEPTNVSCSNFVKDNFVGIGVMRTKCLECESSTYKKEEFTNIDIPIQCDEEEEESGYNFFINRILASETLRDVNKYWCSECSRLNEAQRTVSYEVLPSVLVLQLKRFTTTASRTYVSKLTDYIPTPLEMDCFCQKCRERPDGPLHRYRLYSVILHLGASLASGHYIACVRAGDVNFDYFQCRRPGLTDATLRSKHTKRGIFKMFSKSNSTPAEPHYKVTNPVCGSISCCGLKLNPSILEERVGGMNGMEARHSPALAGEQDDIWLECDDEQISVISRQQLEELLTSRQPTTTPYLLFYNRIC